jgi:hypothetical protein
MGRPMHIGRTELNCFSDASSCGEYDVVGKQRDEIFGGIRQRLVDCK